jgi:hypothetical protein
MPQTMTPLREDINELDAKLTWTCRLRLSGPTTFLVDG